MINIVSLNYLVTVCWFGQLEVQSELIPFMLRHGIMYTRLTFLACLVRDAVLAYEYLLQPVTFALIVQHCLPSFSHASYHWRKDKGD